MPFTKRGRDVDLVRNAATGRFDLTFETTTGNFAFSDNQAHAVTSLLLEHRGQWWADTSGKRGSKLHTVKVSTRSTPSQLTAFAREALTKAIDDSRIRPEPKVVVTMPTRTRADLTVTYETPDGTAHKILASLGDT